MIQSLGWWFDDQIGLVTLVWQFNDSVRLVVLVSNGASGISLALGCDHTLGRDHTLGQFETFLQEDAMTWAGGVCCRRCHQLGWWHF